MLQTVLPNQSQNTFNHVSHGYVEMLKSYRVGELCAPKFDFDLQYRVHLLWFFHSLPLYNLVLRTKNISSQPSNPQTANFYDYEVLRPLHGPLCSTLQR